MIKKTFNILLILLLFAIHLEARRLKKESIKIDHISDATMMMYSGQYQKAQDELAKVDTNKKEFDFVHYYTIKGMIGIKLQNYKSAISDFKKAVEYTKTKVYLPPVEQKEKFTLYKYFRDKFSQDIKKVKKQEFNPEVLRAKQAGKLYLYISEAYFKLNDFDSAIRSLELAKDEGRSSAKLYLYKAQCYWELKEYSKAFNTLSRGYKSFPKAKQILKQKFYYYTQIGMSQKSIDIANRYLLLKGTIAKDYIVFARLFQKNNQTKEAIKLLQIAKLKFPKNANISALLAYIYLSEDMPYTAANLFENSSYYDNNYTKEATEMFRRVDESAHALYLNSNIVDQEEMIKQKIALFIQRGEFTKIISFKKAFDRYGLLKDENLRYALAYSYFMVKDYNKAEYHLKKLTKSELFSKATVIRKNIQRCKKSSMECI
jgi:tetratricopeptide (TPR) repeat protein